MKIKYIIIDDEPLAHKVIEKYCADLPFMHLQANCYDALQALSFLNRQKADIMFLDLNMPKLKGFDFLRTLDQPPQIIVTSAYQEYALEGYDLNVCDYLLKPFSFERFLKAVNKAVDALPAKKQAAPAVTKTASEDSVFIKGEKKYHNVRLGDILYIEACGNYSTIYMLKGAIVTPEKISDLARLLAEDSFTRVHKSYIVSVGKIDEIEGNHIKIGKKNIPIGRVYKMNVSRLLK